MQPVILSTAKDLPAASFQYQFHRAVVGTVDLRVDRGGRNAVLHRFGDDEIVDAPSRVPLSGLHAVGPPAVSAGKIRVQKAEGVHETGSEQFRHLAAFRIGKACRPSGNHDLFSVIMICLGDYNADECTGILRLLSILFLSDETVEKKKRMLEKEFHIPMTAELEKKVIEVGSFSDYIEQRGIEKGRKIGVREGRRQGKHQGRRQGKREGIREGRQEGIREGRQEGFNDSMLHSIKNVMESLNITVEQAMEILKVPTDRRKFFSQAVRKKQ